MPSTKHSRHRAREFVLQGLYQRFLSGNEPAAIAAHLRDVTGFDKSDVALFERIWTGVLPSLDALFDAVAPDLDRPRDALSPIEKGVLAIGAWELLHAPETPDRVVINEAVELAKAYGGTDGHKYVNGVLDKLAIRARAAEVEAGARTGLAKLLEARAAFEGVEATAFPASCGHETNRAAKWLWANSR